jgi:hypothetical protein
MRSSLFALLALAATTLASIEAQSSVETLCTAFGRTCDCPWYVRDCIPACHVQPRIKCAPAS